MNIVKFPTAAWTQPIHRFPVWYVCPITGCLEYVGGETLDLAHRALEAHIRQDHPRSEPPSAA